MSDDEMPDSNEDCRLCEGCGEIQALIDGDSHYLPCPECMCRDHRDHLERVEAERDRADKLIDDVCQLLRDSGAKGHHLAALVCDLRDERDRMREALERCGEGMGMAIHDSRNLLRVVTIARAALSPTTDDQEQSDAD